MCESFFISYVPGLSRIATWFMLCHPQASLVSLFFPYTTLFRSLPEGIVSVTPLLITRSPAVEAPDVSPLMVPPDQFADPVTRSEEHTSELQSPYELVCRLLLEKKNSCPPLLLSVDPIVLTVTAT